ncbi:GIY-YIG nuclease family protein [Paramicrobacterium agarici]|uniref:GIY-YIG nuclease family protein n=1 Tax=Paramicrobacterium agarici TaxID=630514 RepID=UPI001FE2E869|nr:GIY-YIG nuclease family protein [Microbacterium agarici]
MATGGNSVQGAMPGPCLLCGSTVGVRRSNGWHCGICSWRVGDVPDPELPLPRVDVVYYIRYADRVKIGTSHKPRQRLRALWHNELLAFERGGRDVERRRHVQFAHLREGGEWFRADTVLLEHAAALSAAGDPWHAYARWVSEALSAR